MHHHKLGISRFPNSLYVSWFKLPIAPVLGATREALETGANVPKSEAFAVDLGKVRVLVVDDEPDAGEMVGIVLGQSGALVTVVTSAAEALQRLQTEPFDILVSDIGMPGQDGYQLMRELRRRPAEQGGTVPAVALTAFARPEDRTRAVLSGYQVHLTKPVEPWELTATVGSLLGRYSER